MISFCDLKPQWNELKEEILSNVERVFEHGQFIMGPEVGQCEKALADFAGTNHAICCSNGTVALMLALMAHDVGHGDEVLVPAFSFFASAEAVSLVGARPIFVDVDPKTYLMDPVLTREKITSRTKAIMPVSLFGQAAHMEEFNRIACEKGLKVIEDGAQSFGATYHSKKSCALSSIGCTSFFPAKPLGCYGDGGALFTDDQNLYEKLRILRHHGESSRYQHQLIGMNGRLDTLQCAILLVKLKRFPWEIAQREKLAQRYLKELSPLQDRIQLPSVRTGNTSVWAQFTVHVGNSQKRGEIQEFLRVRGIPTAIHYPLPIPKQKAYAEYNEESYPHSEWASSGVLSLPLYADLSEESQATIIHTFKSALS